MSEETFNILQHTCFEFREKTKEEVLEWIDNIFKLYNLPYEIIPEGVVFKVEDTILKDTKGNQEPITDIYFKVFWNGQLAVRRFSFTFKQAHKNYIHSHVGSGTDLDSWRTTICFGNVISIVTFTKTLVSFLCIHKTFCSTESTDTAPYFRIQTLKDVTGVVKKVPTMSQIDDFPKYLEIVENIRIRQDNGRITFDIFHNEEELQKLAIENNWLSYYSNGICYQSINHRLPQEEGIHESETDFVFKGKPVKKVIYVQKDDLLPEPQICKITIDYYQDKIKRMLNKELLHETINPNGF